MSTARGVLAAISVAIPLGACASRPECTDANAPTGSGAHLLSVGRSQPRTWRVDLSPELDGDPNGRPTLVADSKGGVAYALSSQTGNVLVGRLDADGHSLWTRSLEGRPEPAVLCVAPTGDITAAIDTTQPAGVAVMMLDERGGVRWKESLPTEFAPPIRMVATDERLFVIAAGRAHRVSTSDVAVRTYRWDGTRVVSWLLPDTRVIGAAAIGDDLVLAVWVPSPVSPGVDDGSPGSHEVVAYDPCGDLRWRRPTDDPIEAVFASGRAVDVVLRHKIEPSRSRLPCAPGDLMCAMKIGMSRDVSYTLMELTETGDVGWSRIIRNQKSGWHLPLAGDPGKVSDVSFVSVSRCSGGSDWLGNRRGERLVRLTHSSYDCDDGCGGTQSHYALLDARAELLWQRGVFANPSDVIDDAALSLGEDGSVFESAVLHRGGGRLPLYIARTR